MGALSVAALYALNPVVRLRTWVQWQRQNELGAWLFSQDLQVTLKLLREGIDEAHAQSPPRFDIERWRKTDAFVPAHGDHHLIFRTRRINVTETISQFPAG